LHPLLRRAYNYLRPIRNAETSKTEAQGEARLAQRVSYDLIFATIFLFALHGTSAFKVFLILYANYTLATSLSRNYIPAATWIFNIAVLFANEVCSGYPYSRLAQLVPFGASAGWGTWLESYGGLIPRWEILFNITALRLISFNLDYYWSLEQRGSSPVEVSTGISQADSKTRTPTDMLKKKQLDPTNLSERDRITIPASRSAYSFSNYLSYTLYSPLYLAGPIVTFNDYIYQLRFPSPSITTKRTILYAVRFLICLLVMEFVLHYIYAVAISKCNPDWTLYTPFQLGMLGYFNLHIIWLKLLIPWRFFRLWALLDNLDPPENMVRCMTDNYSALAFWRGWHRSFNRWIVRYIFIPLGGSGRGTSQVRALTNMTIVFTFVALWHDISLRLLTWSWLIILFLLPEVLCTKVLFPARNFTTRPGLYRFLSGIGAVTNCVMMMSANLVGFAIGLDGLKSWLMGLFGSQEGWMFLTIAIPVCYVGVMVMFEHREAERRLGIFMSC